MTARTFAMEHARPLRKSPVAMLFFLGVVQCMVGCAQPRIGSWEGPPSPLRADEQCTILRWKQESTPFPEMFIRKPGKYCIDRDYTADLRGCLHGCRGYFIDINADDVDLDLRGHVLTANRGSFGGVAAIGNNISVRNGIIRGGGDGVLINARRSPGWASIYKDELPRHFTGYDTAVQAKIENMVIESGTVPIEAAGPNVIIRENRIRATIETGDRQLDALYLHTRVAVIAVFGPRSRIEGNVIEQTTRTGGRGPAPSILLRDGKDAVVRGNRITNRGDRVGTSAIGLKNSVDVTIENNALIGIERAVFTHGEGSSFVLIQ